METKDKHIEEENTKMRIAKFVRERRKKFGMSQKELADRCGISTQTLSNLELGKSDYYVGVLGLLERELKCRFILVLNEDLE